MYNKEMKDEYIKIALESNPVSENLYRVIFGAIDKMEQTLGKDVSDFSSNEILEYYRSLSTPSLERLLVINSALNRYTKYVLSCGPTKDNQNHFKEISRDALLTCINVGAAKNKISTRKMLLSEIDFIENPSEKFIVLGIFEGLRGKSYDRMFNLRRESFGKDTVTFTEYNGKETTLSISKKLIDYALESVDEYRSFSYAADHTIVTGMGYREDDDRVVKDLKNVRSLNNDLALFARRIYGKLVRISQFFGKSYYEAQALKESGRIEWLRNIMKEQHVSSLTAIMRYNEDEESLTRYGKIHDPGLYHKKYVDFLERE